MENEILNELSRLRMELKDLKLVLSAMGKDNADNFSKINENTKNRIADATEEILREVHKITREVAHSS